MELSLHKKQLDFVNSPANEVFFGGAAGGGKSHVLRADSIMWAMNVPGIQVYLFRRLYKDLLRSHLSGPASYQVMLREFIEDKLVRINYSANEIIWANRSKIVLAHIQHESDLQNYLSQEINVALFDEGSTFTEKMYRFVRSRVRLGGLEVPEEFKHRLPRIGIGSNPRGPMHGYLKKGWVSAAPHGTVFKAPVSDGGMTRQYIPSKLKDNPTLTKNDPDYANRLRGLGDSALVDAYLDGDWDAIEGAALEIWDANVHVIPEFEIPFSWKIKRGYDYGYSAPYSVLWAAVSNGESYFNHENQECTLPKGSIIIINEIYGDHEESEKGLKEDVRLTSQKIKILETTELSGKIVKAGPADNAIFNAEQGPSTASIMEDEGIKWTRSNKRPGSRVIGLTLLRRMLSESLKEIPERPCLYVMANCRRLIGHLPLLSVDDKTGEDVDTEDQPDHDYDVIRYLILDQGNQVMTVGVSGT